MNTDTYSGIWKENRWLKKFPWAHTRWNCHRRPDWCTRWTDTGRVNFQDTKTRSCGHPLCKTSWRGWFLICAEKVWFSLWMVFRILRGFLSTRANESFTLLDFIQGFVASIITEDVGEGSRAEFFVEEAWHQCSWAGWGKHPILHECAAVDGPSNKGSNSDLNLKSKTIMLVETQNNRVNKIKPVQYFYQLCIGKSKWYC